MPSEASFFAHLERIHEDMMWEEFCEEEEAPVVCSCCCRRGRGEVNLRADVPMEP